MANRVLIGRHPNLSGNPQGVFVSKPGQDVTGTTLSNFAFTSNIIDNTSGITSLNGQTLTVKYKGSITANLESSGANQRQKQFDVVTWNRSDFNDGSVDRCPLVFIQTSVVTDTTVQNCMGYFFYRNSSTDYLTAQGFHFEVFPYYTATQGKVTCKLTAELRAYPQTVGDQTIGDWPGTDTGDRKIYYAVCSTSLA